MARTVLRILGVEGMSDYVRTQLELSNRAILRYESAFIAVLSLVACATTFAPIVPWEGRPGEVLLVYRVGFVFIAIASVICHVVCTRLAKRKDGTTKPTRLVLITYTVVLLAFAIALTVFDYGATRSFFVYVVALVLIFGLLHIQPVVTITINVIWSSVLVVALTLLGLGSPAAYLTLSSYAFIVVIVSISNFQTSMRAIQASEAVRRLSRHDSLTGTKNRRALNQDFLKAVGHKVFLLLGDIDDFKFYNDSFGHRSGDELLCSFANSLCSAFGHSSVYRYGGDEFIAVALDIDEESFREKIERWRSEFEGIEIDGERFVPTTSGGYVIGEPKDAEDLQNMLRLADIRLYDAKQVGRNKVLGIEYEGDRAAQKAFEAANLRERRAGETDLLTGLPSMTYFLIHARSLLESPGLQGEAFHFVYFNVENMKTYNERFGMAAGDELLVFAAQEIQGAFAHALATRMGDDRFAVLVHGEDPVPGIRQVHDAVREHNRESSTIIRAGVYEYEQGVEVSTACDFAKLACDHIKGKHNVYHYVYDESLRKALERKQFILDRFEDALEKDHIKPYYQPIIRTTSGRVCGFEALARWVDPVDGFIPPGDFIPVLEEFRLVHLLDLKIVDCVCRDIRAWTNDGLEPLPVSVNLSRYDIETCDISIEVERVLSAHGVSPSMLNIELTESAFAENTELLSAVIDLFHDLGTQVWMDDFGSGYSSLNVLREFDFDVVKFDMLFLRYSDEESRQRSNMMLPHLISMAKDLGVQTLMEGVETAEQEALLRDMGCEKLQGFAFEEPVPVESVLELFKSGHLSSEQPDESSYYDPVGQLDLATPYAIDPELARSIEMSGGLPAAIVEFRAGRVSYLRWNSSYVDYLNDIGVEGIEASTELLNDMSRPQSQGFVEAAKANRGKAEWVTLSFYEGEDLCTGMGRTVAVDKKRDAAAYLYVAFNVDLYLKRMGLMATEQ